LIGKGCVEIFPEVIRSIEGVEKVDIGGAIGVGGGAVNPGAPRWSAAT